jgi:molybdopterin synthase sulfur carrier subunit
MTIIIKFFAILRDKTNTPEITLQLSTGATIANAIEQIAGQYPSIAPHLSKIACAVNEHYVPPTTELHDGDELALIPPVSGG